MSDYSYSYPCTHLRLSAAVTQELQKTCDTTDSKEDYIIQLRSLLSTQKPVPFALVKKFWTNHKGGIEPRPGDVQRTHFALRTTKSHIDIIIDTASCETFRWYLAAQVDLGLFIGTPGTRCSAPERGTREKVSKTSRTTEPR